MLLEFGCSPDSFTVLKSTYIVRFINLRYKQIKITDTIDYGRKFFQLARFMKIKYVFVIYLWECLFLGSKFSPINQLSNVKTKI